MKEALTQTAAAELCMSMGMKLYTIQNENELQSLFDFVNYEVDTYGWVMINGNFGNNSVWSTSNPTAPLIPAAHPPSNYFAPYGGCLYVTGNSTTRGGYCNPSDFLCEYINPNP